MTQTSHRRAATSALALAAVLCLGACAGRVPAPVALAQATDTTATCEAFAAEIASNNERALSLARQQSNTAAKNVTVAVVGVLLVPALLFAMDLSGADGVELQALRTRNERIAGLMRERNCANIPPATPESARTTAIEEKIRDAAKTGAQPLCKDVGGYEEYKRRTGEVCKL